jgi:signal transduction histidine kinase
MNPGLRHRIRAALVNGVTDPPTPRPARLRRGRIDLVFAADLLIAVICFGATNSTLANQNGLHGSPHSSESLLLTAFVLCAPLLLRTRYPFSAWSASAAAILFTSVIIPPRSISSAAYLPAGVIVYGLCLYAVAVRCEFWVTAGTGIVTALGAAVIDLRTTVIAVIVAAVPLTVGAIVRSRRSNRELLEVQERRHEGERALLEERQRIARELHDVVAHHMSVIAIQAEAAPYKAADPPPELVESFSEIRASALSGLNELRRVLGVLRSDTPGTTPQPGLTDLAGLLESARSGGVTVASTVTGGPRPLPQGVDLSAYRIVQEALSNAMRHAPGATVTVELHYGEASLVIAVRNDRCPPGARTGAEDHRGARGNGAALGGGGGHGIIGMRERAAMLGGHLSAGPTANGEFLVTAALPLDNEGRQAPQDQA